MRRLFPLFLLAAMAGCTPSESTANGGPKTPANTDVGQTDPKKTDTKTDGKTPDGKTDPTADKGTSPKPSTDKPAYRDEQGLAELTQDLVALPLAAAPKGLPEAPKTCQAFVKRKPKPAAACAEPDKALEALDKALAETKADKRDELLLGLESCAGLPAGVTRALRAEFAPAECADVIVESLVNAPPKGMDGTVYATLRGLATAARLARTGANPPKLAAPFEVKRVKEFTAGPMKDWMVEQAQAIQELSNESTKLNFYARGVAAIEAGMAELRVVEVVRAVPLPDSLAKEPEARNIYYAELDQLLDPRKDRGRDAALVGLRDLAAVGVLKDARVERARSLLSRLYGGRRIDALDALVLPALPKLDAKTTIERLASKLPTFYAGLLLGRDDVKKVEILRALLERGVPVRHRLALKGGEMSPETRRLFARGRLELGRVYLRAVDFDQSAALLDGLSATAKTPEDNMLAALVSALRNGPEDAAVMVRSAPVPMLGMGDIAALDAIAKTKDHPMAGFAAFDAALIKQITAPIGADAAFFRDVAARFRQAASLLSDAGLKKTAEERAKAAEAVATAIR